MRIRIVAIGKPTKEYRALINEYEKRLPKYCNFESTELSERANTRKILEKLEGEVIVLDIHGKQYSSEEFSAYISNKKNITFLIGGPEGLPEGIHPDSRLSFGNATLPHQLARVVLTEQIYRAFTILKKEPYHK